jgi:hypothetical protein
MALRTMHSAYQAIFDMTMEREALDSGGAMSLPTATALSLFLTSFQAWKR